MTEPQARDAEATTKKLRVNPVELMIFAAVCGVFVNSVYKLFFDWNGIRSVRTVAASPSAPDETEAANRAPSSIESLRNIEVACESATEQSTDATKVRLSGGICGNTPTAELTRAEIVNESNGTVATVFTDSTSGKFSTDYIPLNTDRNQFSVKFVYRDGKTISNRVTITRR